VLIAHTADGNLAPGAQLLDLILVAAVGALEFCRKCKFDIDVAEQHPIAIQLVSDERLKTPVMHVHRVRVDVPQATGCGAMEATAMEATVLPNVDFEIV